MITTMLGRGAATHGLADAMQKNPMHSVAIFKTFVIGALLR
ncbi:hypothetical protein RMSM_00368 [Rhodopirellula maiorica SM1]|uniref:Uncharacterized protein n=1 Tax=Rhodopirellula maiorica SM1 TaxID=1265738 RepID=M5S959_9BACT|nr:hypothetical protein RMSM_00368 [Rhodopirellula maiorica SM1]